MAVLLGLILLAAAVLKLAGGSYSPLAQSGLATHPTVRTITVVWELLLGWVLVSGRLPGLGWLAASGTFLAFAMFSGVAAAAGSESCGCFGPVAVSPVWVTGFDLLAVAALTLTRPPVGRVTAEWKQHRSAVGLTTAISAALAWGVFGTGADRSVDRLLSGAVLVTDRHVELGEVRPGDARHHDLVVLNAGESDVSIVGGTSDCSCLVSDVPKRVPAGGRVTVRLTLQVPTDARGRIERSMQLWTDLARQPRVRVQVGFNSTPADVPPAGRVLDERGAR